MTSLETSLSKAEQEQYENALFKRRYDADGHLVSKVRRPINRLTLADPFFYPISSPKPQAVQRPTSVRGSINLPLSRILSNKPELVQHLK